MNNGPTKDQLVEFIATMDKLQIEFNPNLSRTEKELSKQIIDQIKNWAQR